MFYNKLSEENKKTLDTFVQEDYNFFLNIFIDDVVQTILSQSYVKGKSGDDIAYIEYTKSG